MNSRITGSVLRQLEPHLFSTTAISLSAATDGMVHLLLAKSAGMRVAPMTWVANVHLVGTVPMLRQLEHHLFSTAAISCSAATGETVHSLLARSASLRVAPRKWVASIRSTYVQVATWVQPVETRRRWW